MHVFQNASMLLNSPRSCRSFDRTVMVDHKNPGPAIRTVWSFQGSDLFTFLSGIFTECCSLCLGLLSPGTQKHKL